MGLAGCGMRRKIEAGCGMKIFWGDRDVLISIGGMLNGFEIDSGLRNSFTESGVLKI